MSELPALATDRSVYKCLKSKCDWLKPLSHGRLGPSNLRIRNGRRFLLFDWMFLALAAGICRLSAI